MLLEISSDEPNDQTMTSSMDGSEFVLWVSYEDSFAFSLGTES